MQSLRRMNAIVKLLLQNPFGFARQTVLVCFLPRQLRQNRQFVLHVFARDSVPESVLKFQNIDLVLFEPKDPRVRQLHDDFIGADIDAEILLEIEAGFGGEGAVQFDSLRASRPCVGQLVFDFDPARQNSQLSDGCRLLQVNAVVDRNARLQVCDVDECRAYPPGNFLQFARGLFGRAHRPGFNAPENDKNDRRGDQRDESQCHRP